MRGILSGYSFNEELLDDPIRLVSSLRTLSSDQPPLILFGNQHELSSKLTDQTFVNFLSQAEIYRSKLFYHLIDQQRFGIGRIMLRTVLGCWFSIAPKSVVVMMTPHCKPYCENGPFFNISHSGDFIALAIHPSRPVGIDIEQVQHHEKWKEMAAMLWPEIVIKHILNFPIHEQSTEFLNQWCQYEATTKAHGLGLSAQWENIACEKPCQLWKLSLPETYLGYAAML